MNKAVLTWLGAMPARQLPLLLGGVLLIAGALIWSVGVRAPLAQLRAQQAERARLVAGGADPQRAVRDEQQLARDIAVIERQLGFDPVPLAPEQAQLRLIDGVQRSAEHHQVQLRAVAPGPARALAGFDELPVDVEAHSSYAALTAWMAQLDSVAPTAAVLAFDLQAGSGAARRGVKLRIAVYQRKQESH